MDRIIRLLAIVVLTYGSSCSSETTLQPTDKNLLFVLAGQSNAEGAVTLDGILRLQEILPPATQTLNAFERERARTAIGNSLGLFCEVESACIDNPQNCPDSPFSFAAADAVIQGLLDSSINWRQLNANYQHPTVQLIAANYVNAGVVILNEMGEEVDNENCVFSSANTSLAGPALERYTPNLKVPLGPGFGAKMEAGSFSFGPELGFGLKISETVPLASIVKVAMGGSSLNDSWRPNGTLYQALLSETERALAATDSQLGGLIWFQGFNDQFENVYCEPLPMRYGQNLRQLITNLRADLNAPQLPIIIVEARNGGELGTIQNAQNAVAAMDANIALVPTKDLSDCFHYGAGSQLLIGERIGAAMDDLMHR